GGPWRSVDPKSRLVWCTAGVRRGAGLGEGSWLHRVLRWPLLYRGGVGFGAGRGTDSGRGGGAGDLLVAHVGVGVGPVTLAVGEADSMPREHKVAENIIRVPFSGVGIQEENGNDGALVVEIDHLGRKRIDAGVFHNQRHLVVNSGAGKIGAGRHIDPDEDV